MTNEQYRCVITNGVCTEETGHFFRAAPFTVTVNNNNYLISFKKGSEHAVIYEINLNGTVLAELTHQDYVPECTVEELEATLNTADAKSIFAAMVRSNISIETSYIAALTDENTLKTISYTITQNNLF